MSCVIHWQLDLVYRTGAACDQLALTLQQLCRYPGMRQDCTRAALELQEILANALSGTYTQRPSCTPPTRTPNPMCRNFTLSDCVEASICPEFVLAHSEASAMQLGPRGRGTPATCAQKCGSPLTAARPASALDLPVIHRSKHQVA